MPEDPMYLPLQVGAAGKESIGYQRDDEGENISVLNPYFCELTGLYWAWKNIDSDYIGLVHYRRYFSYRPHASNKWGAILNQKEVEPELKDTKIFLPAKRIYYIETLYSHYDHTHYGSQLDETRKIIEEYYPKYISSYKKAINRKWGYMFNMMIMEKDLFDSYCSWLFDILFRLRDRIGEQSEEELDKYQARFYGRISEIIFNVWLTEQIKNKTIKEEEIKEIPVINMEEVNWWRKGTSFLNAKFTGKKYNGSF